eukprot:m.290870 g.290870  ORF g.290870 m.290870 type:complete len:52 (-) comp55086_c0_seq1:35-190(-)
MLTVNKLWTTYIAVTFLEEIALILFIAWQKKQGLLLPPLVSAWPYLSAAAS